MRVRDLVLEQVRRCRTGVWVSAAAACIFGTADLAFRGPVIAPAHHGVSDVDL